MEFEEVGPIAYSLDEMRVRGGSEPQPRVRPAHHAHDEPISDLPPLLQVGGSIAHLGATPRIRDAESPHQFANHLGVGPSAAHP